MRILGGFCVLLATSSLATAATFGDVEVYHGICDVSGAIALMEGDVDAGFLVANDEDTILRRYPKGEFEADVQGSPDISSLLGIGTADEADLEATARLGSLVYMIGSHGRNKNGKRRTTREIFASMSVEGSGNALKIGGSHHAGLIEALAEIPALQTSIKLDNTTHAELAPEKDGLNIEGLTADAGGKSLLIGLRNPLSSGKAIIIPLTNPQAVAEGAAKPELGKIQELELVLDASGESEQLGIRSIEYSPGTQSYIIVAGPH